MKHIVSDNTDYTVRFLFDSEWGSIGPKTVFFADGASGENMPVVMDGDTCVMPLIPDWRTVLIGVQAGELHTTRPCAIPVFPSITRQIGDPVPPEEFDKWTQIMARLLSPVDKTSAMTQPVGKGEDGKLWTEPADGASTWSQLSGKPFERIGDTLAVTGGTLDVNIHEVSNAAGGLTTIIG